MGGAPLGRCLFLPNSSKILSTFISLMFTIIVNKITHFSLKNVDMLESLKSNE